MGLIEDANGNPMKTEEPEEESPKNGKNGKGSATRERVDARLLPRGLLIYNLIENTLSLRQAQAAIQGMETMMRQQKMVGDPPQLEMARMALAEAEHTRSIIVNDLNDRYADADAAYWAKLEGELEKPAEAADGEE